MITDGLVTISVRLFQNSGLPQFDAQVGIGKKAVRFNMHFLDHWEIYGSFYPLKIAQWQL